MIGRKKEIEKIERLLASGRSEFLAVTGRRRVGKTYLVDSLLKKYYCFSMTGIQNGSFDNPIGQFQRETGGIRWNEHAPNAYAQEVVDAEVRLEQLLG